MDLTCKLEIVKRHFKVVVPVTVGVAHFSHKGDHRSVLLGVHVVHPCVAWGYTSLKSGALQLQILKKS